MRRSLLARAAAAFASIRPVRSWVVRAVCHLEGGQLWSSTFRELMENYYEVKIGIHSYGPCLTPGGLPPSTRVGNYCSFAAGVQVLRRNHPVDRISQHPFFFNSRLGLIDADSIPAVRDNPLHIGHDVWIGQNVLIAPGCRRIGDSAIVASGSVVTSDVPEFGIVGGVPARLIRYRLPEERRTLLIRSGWWLKPLPELAPLGRFLFHPMSDEDWSELSNAIEAQTAPLREAYSLREK